MLTQFIYTPCRVNLDNSFLGAGNNHYIPVRSSMTVSVALRNAAVHLYLNYTKSLRRTLVEWSTC
jgi:hypothetical protein